MHYTCIHLCASIHFASGPRHAEEHCCLIMFVCQWKHVENKIKNKETDKDNDENDSSEAIVNGESLNLNIIETGKLSLALNEEILVKDTEKN